MTSGEAPGGSAPTIGAEIKALRARHELTQEELAGRVHLSRSAIATSETREATSGVLRGIVAAYPEFKLVLEAHGISLTDNPVTKASEPDDLEDMFFRRSNVLPDLAGRWYALWEATHDGEPILNTEELEIESRPRNRLRVRNLAISPENPDGGYLWVGECRMYDNHFILGTYMAVETAIRSKGVLQLALRASGREIEGQWIGASFDMDFSRGLVVMTRRREELNRALERHRKRVEEEYN